MSYDHIENQIRHENRKFKTLVHVDLIIEDGELDCEHHVFGSIDVENLCKRFELIWNGVKK